MLKRMLLTLAILTCLIIVNGGCDIVAPEPGLEQIKSDLIGETLTQKDLTWHFHALSEFQEVIIVDQLREADTIEYDVSLELKDVFTGRQYTADILMIYQRSGTSWELFSILTMSLESTSDSGAIEV
ncbi:MAG: hypothetical protein JSV32_03310 [Dehalococcoidia bacterium]|nr:MAG: hypothetical protein JSV32_03310 [Dehalococcoidia bacterium]